MAQPLAITPRAARAERERPGSGEIATPDPGHRGTPADVWIPAFHWLGELTVEKIFSSITPRLSHEHGRRHCNLCETWVRSTELELHVRMHRRERQEHDHAAARRREREAKERLRLINRERKLEKALA